MHGHCISTIIIIIILKIIIIILIIYIIIMNIIIVIIVTITIISKMMRSIPTNPYKYLSMNYIAFASLLALVVICNTESNMPIDLFKACLNSLLYQDTISRSEHKRHWKLYNASGSKHSYGRM